MEEFRMKYKSTCSYSVPGGSEDCGEVVVGDCGTVVCAAPRSNGISSVEIVSKAPLFGTEHAVNNKQQSAIGTCLRMLAVLFVDVLPLYDSQYGDAKTCTTRW